MIANLHYLDELLDEMAVPWPNNRTINIVCHGHSVPSGYFATPFVNTFDAYPHLLHQIIKERFPFAVINVIVTGIGGENSIRGAERFEKEVLNHNPDVITIDYGLNDRGFDQKSVKSAWEKMIHLALEQSKKVILLTPTWDNSYLRQDEDWVNLVKQKEQIISLAEQYHIGLADSFACFEKQIVSPDDLPKFLSHVNHPSKEGHKLVAYEIAKYFLAK